MFYYYCVYNNIIALYYISFYLLIPFITLPKKENKLHAPLPTGDFKNNTENEGRDGMEEGAVMPAYVGTRRRLLEILPRQVKQYTQSDTQTAL